MTLWIFYLSGAFLALVGKCFRYCYIGVRRHGKTKTAAFAEWFEMKTIDSQVSWIATFFIVWGIGSVFFLQVHIEGVSGLISGLPVTSWSAGLLGVIAEKAAPDFLKWFYKKLPFYG